jgi:esterase/lipase
MEKKPLLVLHGALGCAKQFDIICTELTKNFDVHCYDLKGHGTRCDGESFVMQDLVDDTISMIYESKLAPCDIFGYSMGGYLALQLAIQNPSIVNRIFTLGTKLKWTPEIAEKENTLLNPVLIKEKVPQYASMLQKMHGDKWDQLVLHTGQMMRNLGLMPLLSDEIKGIKQQVRLGIADKDHMVTLEETTDVFQLLTNCSLIVLPDSRHPIEKVSVERLTYEINAFF